MGLWRGCIASIGRVEVVFASHGTCSPALSSWDGFS